MTKPYREPGLDTLLGLHGETLFVDDAGHWVKVRRGADGADAGASARPQLFADAARAGRFEGGRDSTTRTRCGSGGRRKPERDDRHRLRTIRPYEYEDAATLPEDFWKEVDHILRER